MHTAIVFGHEAKLIGFGLHLHCSFAGHLVTPLRSSDLDRAQACEYKTKNTEQAQDIHLLLSVSYFID